MNLETAEGYNIPAVEVWIAQNVPSLRPPFQWVRLEGGHSNLTYQIIDSARQVAVIRRPPQGELLPKAHDMGREWKVISALYPTDVPVARPYAFCEDREVTGAWFYVMGYVEGASLYTAEDIVKHIPRNGREIFAKSYIDVLASLHRFEPEKIGLGRLGRPDNYIARQISVWYGSWMASIEASRIDDPRAHALKDYFMANLPDQEMGRVVHGDYGLHNMLVGKDSRIAAVLDWEICTLGDPLADFAYALNRWPQSDTQAADASEALEAPTPWPDREGLVRRYAKKSGRDLSNLSYYTAFNRWKSALIAQGVYARYLDGAKSTDGVDLDRFYNEIGNGLNLAEVALN